MHRWHHDLTLPPPARTPPLLCRVLMATHKSFERPRERFSLGLGSSRYQLTRVSPVAYVALGLRRLHQDICMNAQG